MSNADNIQSAIKALKEDFGERLSVSAATREHHGTDFSYHEPFSPDAVVYVQNTEEVQRVVKICAALQVPIIPFGTGTSLEGHIAALHGGVCIDLSQMNRILEVHPGDMDAVVEPGVTRKQLNQHIRDTGMFFSLDPGADASIGGMAATRASGTNSVRYGTMREVVMAMKVVVPSGEVMSVGSRARKSSMGYDLSRLFVGSEGTLGIITEVTVRLFPVPEAISAGICAFETLEGAVDTVIQTIQMGVPIARVELLDAFAIRTTNNYSNLGLKEAPTLFLEFHGSAASVKEQAETVQAIAAEHGGGGFEWATQTEDRERLWKARHDAGFSARAMRPGCRGYSTDACVPISELTTQILAARRDVDASFLMGRIMGHVGDGNFHVTYLVMPDQEAEIAEAKRLSTLVAERAIAAGGTASGEHGVGYGKLPFMRMEHGAAVDIMRAVKLALDPQGIMNPGKIIPPAASAQ